MFDLVISGGTIIDGTGRPRFKADVGITGERITAVGALGGAEGSRCVDAAGKIVAPGLIDAHVHGDLALLADPRHEPAVRQGVTTYIVGQDGVAMAPASPATLDYMRRYTAGFNGNFPTPGLAWSRLDEYLALFEHRCAINVASLVPNGNVRMEVMGLDTRRPTREELTHMRRLVREAMEQGAVGLSTGLDYIPSRYADTDELIELCREIAPFGGVYVTHMRGYAPETVIAALEEVERIGKEAGCAVHISHFNSLADQVIPQLDAMRSRGIDVTFDLYCYLFGSTILGMIALPPDVQEGGVDATLERLVAPFSMRQIALRVESNRGRLEKVRLGSVPAPLFKHFEGMTLGEAAERTGLQLGDLVCDILYATEMATNCIVPHNPRRTDDDIHQLMRHPVMTGGSDGIYVGGKPHPRGTGCFARFLGHYVRAGVWGLEEAIAKCSGHTARRFGLADRGRIAPGLAADVIVFDPKAIADRSTFDDGTALAAGMDHVVVNGRLVLHNTQRTPELPGRGLRRQSAVGSKQ
jgi:N-acyl-D-amino-acid deacylase